MSKRRKLEIISAVLILCVLFAVLVFIHLNRNREAREAVPADIVLEGDNASVSGNGVYVLDGSVYFTMGGTFRLSGELTDGSLVIELYEPSEVHLLLDGAQVSRSGDAALIIENAGKVVLTLLEGTESTFLRTGPEDDAEGNERHKGAVFSGENLLIDGDGSLSISSDQDHGIVSKKDLTIAGGSVTISSPDEAILSDRDPVIDGGELIIGEASHG